MQDTFGGVAANDKGIDGGTVAEELHTACGVVGERQFAIVAGMIEYAVHATGQIEWDIFIATAVVYPLSILVAQIESLTAEVHFAETFSCTNKTLVVLCFKR